MGWHLDGRVSAVVGTHRHVQTADERLLPEGHRLHHRSRPDRPDRLGHRRRAGAAPRALPLPDAEPLRARQGARHAPGRGDPHRSRDRSRAVHRASARPPPRLTVSAQILSGKAVAAKVLADVKAGVAALRRARRACTHARGRPGRRGSRLADLRPQQEARGRRGRHHHARLPLPRRAARRRSCSTRSRGSIAIPSIHGILLQLPLPKGMDEDAAVAAIAPEKDADGLHPVNLGNLLGGKPGAVPVHAGRVHRDPRPLRHPDRGRGGGGGRPLAPGRQAARPAAARRATPP